MQAQNETFALCFAPVGTRCAYCLKMGGDDMMQSVRRLNLETGQTDAVSYVCAEFGPCAERRHKIRHVSN